jgi:TfoX/Sxy family transcriptional regulator of competence genes
MAYNEKLTNKVRASFAHLSQVEEKKMFRGITFMVNGKKCISVGDNEIMCRIDPALHEASVAKNGCCSVVMRGREYKGYVYINEEGMKTKKDFDYWIMLALEFNKKARASKKKNKK